MVGPLRGGRGVTPPTTKQKTTFFSINGENSPGSCIMEILFYEVRHFSPNFHEFTGSKTICICQKKSPFFSPKMEKNFFCQNPLRLNKKKIKKSGTDH